MTHLHNIQRMPKKFRLYCVVQVDKKTINIFVKSFILEFTILETNTLSFRVHTA